MTGSSQIRSAAAAELLGNLAHRHTAVSEITARFGFPLAPGSDTVMVIKTTRAHHVCLHQTTFNWRISTLPLDDIGPEGGSYDNAWCYTGRYAFWTALHQAMDWPPDDDGNHVPDLWYRNPMTGERRKEHLL